MPDNDDIPLTITALVLAWLAYRAGAHTQRSLSTWNDHRDLRTKTNIYRERRWNHLYWAVVGWCLLMLAVIVLLTTA